MKVEESIIIDRSPEDVQDVLYLGRADPEAIRKAAARNGLPIDRITEVRVLDPYFYR